MPALKKTGLEKISSSMVMLVNEGLAAALARVSMSWANERDHQRTAHRICTDVVRLVEACDVASLAVLARRGRWRTLAASADLGLELDSTQRAQDAGPTVSALESGRLEHAGRIGVESRWRAWRADAERLGARSVVAVPLRQDGPVVGALTLYSHRLAVWSSAELEAAGLYAVHATVALDAAKSITGLQSALRTRHTIGVAQGILMERHQITLERSFDVLRRFSSTSNAPVADVAAGLVDDLGRTALAGEERQSFEQPTIG